MPLVIESWLILWCVDHFSAPMVSVKNCPDSAIRFVSFASDPGLTSQPRRRKFNGMKSAKTLPKRRGQPYAQPALVLTLLVLLPVAGCNHAPPLQSQPLTKDGHSQQPPAAPAPVEAPTPPESVPEGPRYAVQVAAYDQRAGAEALASRLSEKYGLQTLVARAEVRGETKYRVRLLVKNKDQAESLANTFLRTEKLKVWIVALGANWVPPQEPATTPETNRTPKTEGSQISKRRNESKQEKKEASQTTSPRGNAPIVAENKAKSPEYKPSTAQSNENAEIQRKLVDLTGKLAVCTGLLVLVGVLQIVVLIGQVIVYRRTSSLMRSTAAERQLRAYALSRSQEESHDSIPD